jgi:hypothetical protein
MLDESRIARRQVLGDRGVLFLVADHVPHGRQAARDAVCAWWDWLAERDRGEGHDGPWTLGGGGGAGNTALLDGRMAASARLTPGAGGGVVEIR